MENKLNDNKKEILKQVIISDINNENISEQAMINRVRGAISALFVMTDIIDLETYKKMTDEIFNYVVEKKTKAELGKALENIIDNM